MPFVLRGGEFLKIAGVNLLLPREDRERMGANRLVLQFLYPLIGSRFFKSHIVIGGFCTPGIFNHLFDQIFQLCQTSQTPEFSLISCRNVRRFSR